MKTGELSPFQEALHKAKWSLVPLSLIMSLRYFVWRLSETVNFSTPIQTTVSVILLTAEIVGYATFILFYWQTYSPTKIPPVPLDDDEELPTVDVFVTIYNEPADVLFRTLAGATALDYPADKLTIYVLDDGARKVIKDMAADFGARYIAREDRRDAKAGNVNNGLANSAGDLILILDCDHIPVCSFLKETIGFFKDPAVAFVQTPHHFYNPDCYRKNLFLEQELANEQDLFFHVIQPGRNRRNSAIFAGSAAVMRRSALEEIGGCMTASAIEDLHTGMELHARGYTSVYYDRTLSGALSPENFMGYLTQRTRWTRGGVQVFLLDNPLFKAGLNLTQRFFYFASLIYFFHGWIRLIFLFAPLSFLVFNIQPIVAGTFTLATYFLPHYILSHFIFNKICREYRSPFWSDVYETGGSFFLAWTAFITLFRPEKLIFQVTPKGEIQPAHEVFHWRYVLPHIILMGFLLAGIINATYHMMGTGLTLDSYSLSCGWAVFNILLLATSIEVAREHPHKRVAHRVHRAIPCELSFVGSSLRGNTLDICEHGMALQLEEQRHIDSHVRVMLMGDFNMSAELDAEVLRTEWLEEGRCKVALRFLNVTPSQRRALIRHIFSPSESWNGVVRQTLKPLRSFSHIAGVTVRKRAKKQPAAKVHGPRFQKSIPCELSVMGRSVSAMTFDLCSTGAVLSVDPELTMPKKLEIRFPLPGEGKLAVQAEVVRRIRSADGEHRYEVHFIHPSHIDPHSFQEGIIAA